MMVFSGIFIGCVWCVWVYEQVDVYENVDIHIFKYDE
jgi:hypothetical protein